MHEEKQIERLLKQLNKNNIHYVVVGGVPAILYGVERTTTDIDIIIDSHSPSIERVINILERMKYTGVHTCTTPHSFIMPVKALTSQYILEVGCVSFRDADNELFPVDVAVIDSRTYKDLIVRSVVVPFGKETMKCPDIEKLIEMKKEAGRPKDAEDIEMLENILRKLKKRKKYYE